MEPPPPPSRRKEFEEKLAAVREHCVHFLTRSRGATIVTSTDYRSLGVTTLLTNYFRLNDAEKKRIANSRDWGASADVMAWKNTVDAGSMIEGYCTPLGSVKFKDSHDSYVQFDTLFLQNNLVPLADGEMDIGHNNILCKEAPDSEVDVHPTGAIDMLKYNRRRRKLTLIELKTSKTHKNFTTMENAFLKQKHIKQLHFYALMLKNMFDCARIPFDSTDFELVIVGVHETTMQIAMWRINYMPKHFLGENWGEGRWHSILSSLRRIQSHEVRCSGCGKEAHFQDQVNTRLFWCSKLCRDANKR